MLVDAAQAYGLQRPGAGRDIVVSATLIEAQVLEFASMLVDAAQAHVLQRPSAKWPCA